MKLMITHSPLTDARARESALDPRHSFIVQAPAGSGKTELLTQRFLVLLNYVNVPEEILAITFTKKSSHEMRARIINALKNARQTATEPDSAHAKKTWHLAKKVLARDQQLQWHLIENPNQLRIQTIDSFNVSLTKYLPIVSQFGATPEITDDPTMLYREAVQELLSHLEEEVEWLEPIEKLLLHTDNNLNTVEKLLIAMLAKRDQWLPHITSNSQNPELKMQLESYLQDTIQEAITQVTAIFPSHLMAEILALMRFAGHNLLRDGSSSLLTQLIDITHLSKLTDWLGVAELLLTKDHDVRKQVDKRQGFPAEKTPEYSAMKARMLAMLEQLSLDDILRTRLAALRFLPSAEYTLSQWDTLKALQTILKVAAALLRMTFQKYGKIDYIENAQAALIALGSEEAPTDLALALDYRIQHILVDEFQDTANTQYRLLEKLTAGWQMDDGRTLFVVGDPMQSIYRFREAEVGLFIRARLQGLNQLYLEPLTLQVNFRSTPQIVEWVNQHFNSVLPRIEDIATGAVAYSPSVSQMSLLPETVSTDSSVSLHALLATEEGNEQALKIIEILQETKKNNPDGSIAILVRTRTHLKCIIPALKKANIPYRAIDIDPLSLRPVIQDLMALTRALLLPTDRIAWLAVLRAPWAGLTLNDLLVLSENNLRLSLLKNLQAEAILATLSPDGQKRLARILPILLHRVSERYRYSLRTLVESTWILLGGPASVDQVTDLDDAEAYFKLLEKIDTANHFIAAEELERLVKKLYAAPATHADNALQIMTIHNAKGLEFDTVILPELQRSPANDDKQLLLWMERPRQDGKSDLLMAPMNAVGDKDDSIYNYIKLQSKQKLTYEMGRLLYVAVTRAKKNLHLLFSEKEQDKNPDANSLLGVLWPAIKNTISKPSVSPTLKQTINQTPLIHSLRRITLDWQSPVQETLETSALTYHQNKAGFHLTHETPRLVGTLMHEVLNQLARAGTKWWQSESLATQTRFLQQQLIQMGLPKSEMAYALSTLLTGIQHILQDERGQWILAHHKDAQSEFPLTACIDNEIHSLIIDRTFVDESGVRWIIDYKTTIFTADDLENFLNDKQKEHEKQLWLYQKAMQQMDERPIQLGLYFPMVPVWHEFHL